MDKIQVIKKSGDIENYSAEKIQKAILKSADRIGRKLDEKIMGEILEAIQTEAENPLLKGQVHVYDMHKIVCRVLKQFAPDVAHSYQNYRDYKLGCVADLETLFKQTKDVLYLGDRENANFDSALASTKGSLIRGYLTKMLYQKHFLHKDELEAIRRGTIYIHD